MEHRFKVGRGGIWFMFLFVAVGGAGGAVLGAMNHEWAMAVLGLLGAVTSGAMCWWLPGVLTISESGFSIERRRGSQKLAWAEVTSAVWSGHGAGALTAMAADNWVLNITGGAGAKPTVVVLTGPMVERQAEVRALFEKHLPRP